MTLAEYRAEMQELRRGYTGATISLLERALADGVDPAAVVAEAEPVDKPKPVRKKAAPKMEFDL